MKKLFILVLAALLGFMVYRHQLTGVAGDSPMGGTSDASYLTGRGSLMETIRQSRRESGQDNSGFGSHPGNRGEGTDSSGKDSGFGSAGGIGKVGNPYGAAGKSSGSAWR